MNRKSKMLVGPCRLKMQTVYGYNNLMNFEFRGAHIFGFILKINGAILPNETLVANQHTR